MNPVTLYLEKFKGILAEGQGLRKTIAESVKEVVGKSIEEKDITVKAGVATLHVSPALRSAVFMAREKITEAIKKRSSASISVR